MRRTPWSRALHLSVVVVAAVVFPASGSGPATAGDGISPQDVPAVRPVDPSGHPESWCATGEDLERHLAVMARRPWKTSPPGQWTAAAAPVVTSVDGVLVIEDSGSILRNDRVVDVAAQSIELIPAGDGYQITSIPATYEQPIGQPFLVDAFSWTSQPLTLNSLTFPFGGQQRSTLWITPANLIAFEPPSQPVVIGLCALGCFIDEPQTLLDRTPRISPLQHGETLYGFNVFTRELADRLIVTWQYSNPQNMDVQAVLFADGRIRFNYNQILGIFHGAAVVATGNDAFWSDLRLGGEASDPSGDVTIPAPDGPALDLTGATARQVGTSELIQVELTLAEPPPADEELDLFYLIEIREVGSDPEPIASLYYQWRNGEFRWMTEAMEHDGTTLRFHIRLTDLALGGETLHLAVSTFRGSAPYEDGDALDFDVDFVAPAGPMMLDLSTELPLTVGDRPIYEAFTLPAFQPGEALAAASPAFEDPAAIEAFAAFQNLWTDIIFYAGGYHAGGNNGADGAGLGTNALPRSPGMLHLNNLYNYGDEERTMQVLNHELGHRWLYKISIDEGGPPTSILNPISAHPAGWVHTAGIESVYYPLDFSVMGGSWWTNNGNGTFTSPASNVGAGNGFSWHELYLMGLLDATQVKNWGYIADPSPPLNQAYWAPAATTVSGTWVPVTIQQVIAAEGPRVPAYPDTIQHFLAPMTLVVRPGTALQSEIDTLNGFCDTWQTRFSEATGSRGTMRCRFHPPVIEIIDPVPAAVTILAGDAVDFEGTFSDADGDGGELRWSFRGVAPDTTGPGPHPITFDTTGSYTVELTGVDDVGMLAVASETVDVTVDCPGAAPSDEVTGLVLSREAGEIRFRWNDVPVTPADYVVLDAETAQGPFLPAGSATTGSTGVLLPVPTGNAFYVVAARNGAGCLGPH